MFGRKEYKIVGGFSTNIGNVRSVNQDAIFFRNEKQHGIYLMVGAVCDGIGGLDRGEIASSMIVQGMGNWYDRIIGEVNLKKTEPDTLYSHFLDAADEWNGQIIDYRNNNSIKTGSTMSALILFKEQYFIFQVGDSRVYLYDNTLRQLTSDETNFHMHDGQIKGYLSNYMGKNENLVYSSHNGRLKRESIFLCCSDGFYHHLVEDDVRNLYNQRSVKKDYVGCSAELIKRMMERGERDNISLGIIYVS